MSYKPKYLGHVNVYVRNVERSHQWYEEVLGLHTYDYIPGRAAFMSADLNQSHEVALMQVGDDAPLQRKRQVGLNHMAWMMHSLEDLKEVYQRLKEKMSRLIMSQITASRLAFISATRTAMAWKSRTNCHAASGRLMITSSLPKNGRAGSFLVPGTNMPAPPLTAC